MAKQLAPRGRAPTVFQEPIGGRTPTQKMQASQGRQTARAILGAEGKAPTRGLSQKVVRRTLASPEAKQIQQSAKPFLAKPKKSFLQKLEGDAGSALNAVSDFGRASQAQRSFASVNPPLPKGQKISEEGLFDPVKFAAALRGPVSAVGHVLEPAKAPTLDVLENLTRPLHSIANTALYRVEHPEDRNPMTFSPGVQRAALRGLENKDKTTFSDVLKAAGVHNKAVAAIAGFTLDTGLDPVTYAVGGLNIPAEAAAREAGAKAAERAGQRLAEASPGDVLHAKAQAFKRAYEETYAAHPSKARAPHIGFRVHVPGTNLTKELRTSGKLPGRLSADVRLKVGTKVRETPIVQGIARTLAPDFRPAGLDRAEHELFRQGLRSFRAHVGIGERDVTLRARAFARAVPDAQDRTRIVDAIERQQVHTLPDHLQGPALHLVADFKGAQHAEQIRNLLRPLNESGRPEVPQVTADVEHAQRLNRAAAANLARVERQWRSQIKRSGVAEGRARVLVGQADRKAAERAAAVRERGVQGPFKVGLGRLDPGQQAELKTFGQELKAGKIEEGLGSKPAATLNRLERERAGELLSQRDVRNARDGAKAAQRNLENEKALAKVERGAHTRAIRLQAEYDAAAKGYFPHVGEEQLAPPETQLAPRNYARQGTSPKLKSSMKRLMREPISEINARSAGKFSTDIPAVYAQRMGESVRRTGLHDFWEHLAGAGRELTPGAEVRLGDGDAVYRVLPDARPVELSLPGRPGQISFKKVEDALAKTEAGGLRDGERYVVLNRNLVNHADRELSRRVTSEHALVRGYDKLQGRIKTLQTIPNPGYHVNNLVGDLFNARRGGMTTRDLKDALKVIRAGRHERKALENVSSVDQVDALHDFNLLKKHPLSEHEVTGTIKIGKQQVPVMELLQRAEHSLALDAGFQGRELRELTGTAEGKLTPTKLVRHLSQSRENLPRVASFVGALKRGMTDVQAAAHVIEHHFDYGDLTPTEQVLLRRVIPFYTFFARNTRLQSKFLARPGPYATYEKAREEAGKAGGRPADLAHLLSYYQQRGGPIPGPGGTEIFPKLPLTDLGQLPIGSPKVVLDQEFSNVLNRLSPLLTIPAELATNTNIFYKEPINPNTGGAIGQGSRVPAPSWVGHLPGLLKAALGVRQIRDPRHHDKLIWGWNPKAPLILGTLPQTNLGTGVTNPAETRQPGDVARTLFSYGTGLHVVKPSPQDNAINALYTRRDALQAVVNDLGQENKQGTHRYKQMSKELRQLSDQITTLRVKRGDTGLKLPHHKATTIEGQIRDELDQFKKDETQSQAAQIQKELQDFKQSVGAP